MAVSRGSFVQTEVGGVGDQHGAKFIPVLEHEFQRIDGQMAWGYPDEFGEQVAELRERFR